MDRIAEVDDLGNQKPYKAAQLLAQHMITAAAEVDISERTLIAAAERLGVRSQRGQWWLPG